MSLYRKHRPQKFKDIVGQEHVKKTILSALKRNKVSHAYIFAGPRGTGKTSTARLLAKALNCPKKDPEPCNRCSSCKEHLSQKSLDLLEIDAASNRGIDDIRDLREKIKFAPNSSQYKVFIIDEVHMLTGEAFNAFLKTLEEPPSHAIFILATTEPHKVPATILSRCQRFDFHPLSISDIVKELKRISKIEKINFEEDALKMIAAAAGGGMRDAISILDQISSSGRKISKIEVQKILGAAPERAVIRLFDSIIEKDLGLGVEIISSIEDKGYNMDNFRENFVLFMQRVLVYKASNNEKVLKENYSKESFIKIKKQASSLELERLLRTIKIISEYSLIEKDTLPSLGFEMALTELAGIDKKEKDTDKNDDQGGSAVEGDNKSLKVEKIDWKEVVNKVRAHNNSLAAILDSAKIVNIKDNKFFLEVEFSFYRDKINHHKNRQIIEGVLSKITSTTCYIQCEITKKEKNKGLKSLALEVLG